MFGDSSITNHAYISSTFSVEDIWHMAEVSLAFHKQANPNALESVFDSFGVEEARSLYQWALRKPFGPDGSCKIAVVKAASITHEAQNALLKLLEEPPSHTYFFLLTPAAASLLPTLLSRVQIIETEEEGKALKYERGKKFLAGDISERLKLVGSIIKAKNKAKAQALLQELEYLSKDEKVLIAERWLAGRSASLKMILECLAITMLKSKNVSR